jgi:hypothetical protein
MRRRVVDVGGQPHDVLHARVLDGGEQVGEFALAAERRAVALSDRTLCDK